MTRHHSRPWAPLLLMLLCTPALVAWHPLRSKVSEVEQGNAALLAGDAEAARQAYDQAATKIPDSPALQYNRGLALLAAKQPEEALPLLAKATLATDPELRYRAFFALGSARYQQEDWQGAVDAFKAALKLRPDDDDARLNFELSWFKLHPPCRLLEDKQEPNDTPETAKQLTEPLQEPLRACPGNPDWFAVDLPAGASFFVELKVLGEEAPMSLALLGPRGEPLQEAKGGKSIPLELRLVPEAGRYRFRAQVENDLQPAYELSVEAVPPCPMGDDGLEENDAADQARELTRGDQQNLRICPADPDWYTVTLKAGEKLAATLQFPPTRGPLQVDLLAADGQRVLVTGTTANGQASAALTEPVQEEMQVLVRVQGQLAGVDNRYDLKLADEPPDSDQEQPKDDPKDQQQDEKKDQEKDQQQDEKKDQQQQEPKPEQNQDEQQEQPQPIPQDRQAMERALDALRGEDKNVQLDKLLRRIPDQNVEKDW